MLMKSLGVVAAVIQHQSKILCILKGAYKYPYLSNNYEFLDGKVEAEETLEQALIQEIKKTSPQPHPFHPNSLSLKSETSNHQ